MSLRLKILNCYVWAVVRYASESWIINEDTERRINALEIWYYSQVDRIIWAEKVTNSKALKKIGVEKSTVLNWIKGNKRKLIQERKEKENVFK